MKSKELTADFVRNYRYALVLCDMLKDDLQLSLNVLVSCWARMKADEREMTLRLQERWEAAYGELERDWRKELQGEDHE